MRVLPPVFCAFVVVLLLGCTTGIPSVPASVIGKGAFMSGTWREAGKEGRDAFYVVSVDGALVHKPTRMKDWEKPFSIGPGERLLVIDYEGHDPVLLRRGRIAKATVKVSLAPAIHYVADGRDEGRSVTMWIKRKDNGERVSPEVVGLKEDIQFQRPLFVPAPRIEK
jgi:hypothetical protein